jgi:hypothetical protein
MKQSNILEKSGSKDKKSSQGKKDKKDKNNQIT